MDIDKYPGVSGSVANQLNGYFGLVTVIIFFLLQVEFQLPWKGESRINFEYGTRVSNTLKFVLEGVTA